jgi:hypothetical protein
MDPIIRPANAALLIKVQTAEGTAAVPSPSVDAIPYEEDSITPGNPFRSEDSSEANGSLDAAAPLVVGQPYTFTFRFRVKGANAGYTSSVKPPHHQLYSAAGARGFFTSAVSAAALTAGSATTATLGTGYTGTAQLYKGMPLILSGGAGAGHMPLITDYTAGKVATLSDNFSPVLDVTTLAAIPANWTYAWTSPADGAARATDHPCVTLYYYEDGTLYQMMDGRVKIDLDGDTAKPGFAQATVTGVFVGKTDASVPSGLVVANHSAPTLVQGANTPPAIQVNRKGLPISKWSLADGGNITSPEDPNTNYGFGAGQLGGRKVIFGCDPLATLVATRNTLSEIATFANYPIALRFGYTANNRWSLLLPVAQPVDEGVGKRGEFRSNDLSFQAIPNGKDAQNRDCARILCFY